MSDVNVEGNASPEVQDIDPMNADADEINRYIFTEIMGRAASGEHRWRSARCVICGVRRSESARMCRAQLVALDYCSDTSPRCWLDEAARRVTRHQRGHRAFTQWLAENGRLKIPKAEQIARACVSAHKAQTH